MTSIAGACDGTTGGTVPEGGAVVTGEDILAMKDRDRDLRAFINGAFEICRARVGA